jgi:hypothetical protein
LATHSDRAAGSLGGFRAAERPLNVHLMMLESERFLGDLAKAGADHLLTPAEPDLGEEPSTVDVGLPADQIAGEITRRLCASEMVCRKERMFGLSNREGNHGEDVKELYYYLDSVPTYSYARMLYKYPQAEYPYRALVDENARRDKQQPEFELIDTGIFDDDRYFDVEIEYAKASTEDILLRITLHNRGPEAAEIRVLPQVWFRNTWSWSASGRKPELVRAGDDVVAQHEALGVYTAHFDGPDEVKFCENETNFARV